MIAFPRREGTRFRVALRRSVVGRPRGLAPLIGCQQSKETLTLSAILGETAISLSVPAIERSPARVAIPFSLLETIENADADVVMVEELAGGGVRCRWQEGNERKEVDTASSADSASPFPKLPVPNSWQTESSSLLTALHACGKTAAREPGTRYAMNRLQLRGKEGQLAATDGHELLLWGGFRFPFPDCVLVPAIPVFGARELADASEVRIGRTAKHLVVATGPWTLWLTIDQGRFPDILSVFPKSSRLSKILIDDNDAAEILRALPGAPRDEEDRVVVRFEFASRPVVRLGSELELPLDRSSSAGPTLALTLDGRYVERALSLGFREVRAAGSQDGVHFRDNHRSYVVARIHSDAAATRAPQKEVDETASPVAHTLSRNGDSDMAEKNDPLQPQRAIEAPVDPLAEAEALRAALTEVGRRIGRLITGLRQYQKQRRALQSAWTSLRSLRLTATEEP